MLTFVALMLVPLLWLAPAGGAGGDVMHCIGPDTNSEARPQQDSEDCPVLKPTFDGATGQDPPTLSGCPSRFPQALRRGACCRARWKPIDRYVDDITTEGGYSRYYKPPSATSLTALNALVMNGSCEAEPIYLSQRLEAGTVGGVCKAWGCNREHGLGRAEYAGGPACGLALYCGDEDQRVRAKIVPYQDLAGQPVNVSIAYCEEEVRTFEARECCVWNVHEKEWDCPS